MSNGFKIIVATISLILSIILSAGSSLGLAISHEWGASCNNLQCYAGLLMMALGPVTLVFYIIFLKTKKDLFFWLSLIPLATFLIIYFLSLS